MIMDAFIESFSKLSTQLLPILGAIALVCLIVILIKIIKTFSKLDVSVDKANNTIDLVDETLEKVQKPLDTAVKISGTVDKAHDATLNAISTAKEFVAKKAIEVKDKVLSSLDND